MTETYYRTGNYKVDHTTFGGELSLFDFYGYRTMASMADKIARELIFDNQCRRNAELRDNAKNYKEAK